MSDRADSPFRKDPYDGPAGPPPPIPAPRHAPVPRGRQRAGGAFIGAMGAGVAALTWYQATRRGEFLPLGAMVGPAFAVLGAALVAWPGYTEERLARGERIDHLEGARLLTARWWGVLVVALLAGLGFTLALRQGWIGSAS